jgi:hypothetical protein
MLQTVVVLYKLSISIERCPAPHLFDSDHRRFASQHIVCRRPAVFFYNIMLQLGLVLFILNIDGREKHA